FSLRSLFSLLPSGCLLFPLMLSSLFFFTNTAPPDIYTLSLHDALPISAQSPGRRCCCTRGARPVLRIPGRRQGAEQHQRRCARRDRKSTRLNSSHVKISYAVFCLKKKIRKPHINSTCDYTIIRSYRVVY